ncbi:MAG: hypothetical protein N2517_02260 [Ignavibacteria bacterium]|nr:hypothetical protein [Ignavibacteria bacterium]
MRFLIPIFLMVLFSSSCSKERNEKLSQNIDSKSQVEKQSTKESINKEFYSETKASPLKLDQLAEIVPKTILDIRLDKVNKGTTWLSGINVNTVSAEYVSSNGLIVIYIYDYITYKYLPYHLKNLFELSGNKEIFQFKNGIGRLSKDVYLGSGHCDFVYLQRFHIKIEAINYDNFQDVIFEILNSLNLEHLENLLKRRGNEGV